MALTKNINHRRFAASFHLKEVTNQDQDLYRCVTQSERGSGVSNFAALIVRGEDFEKHFQGYLIDFLSTSLLLFKKSDSSIFIYISFFEEFLDVQ